MIWDSLMPKFVNKPVVWLNNLTWTIVRVPEELVAETIKDETTWSHYASLDDHLDYFLLAF